MKSKIPLLLILAPSLLWFGCKPHNPSVATTRAENSNAAAMQKSALDLVLISTLFDIQSLTTDISFSVNYILATFQRNETPSALEVAKYSSQTSRLYWSQYMLNEMLYARTVLLPAFTEARDIWKDAVRVEAWGGWKSSEEANVLRAAVRQIADGNSVLAEKIELMSQSKEVDQNFAKTTSISFENFGSKSDSAVDDLESLIEAIENGIQYPSEKIEAACHSIGGFHSTGAIAMRQLDALASGNESLRNDQNYVEWSKEFTMKNLDAMLDHCNSGKFAVAELKTLLDSILLLKGGNILMPDAAKGKISKARKAISNLRTTLNNVN